MADAGTLRLHREVVPVGELLAAVVAGHRARATAGGVELACEGGGQVWADPVRLRQVLDNLVTNALRHTPTGGRVDLRAFADGGELVIEVRDTGTGIAAEDVPHVFDRFWRAEKSRSRLTGGSGLGLAIVKKLVEGHGGTVGMASSVGEGSRFWVSLPRDTQS
jgi:two-component system sensor histidine kinase BaeS